MKHDEAKALLLKVAIEYPELLVEHSIRGQQLKAFKQVKSGGVVASAEVARAMNVSPTRAAQLLNELVAKEYVKRQQVKLESGGRHYTYQVASAGSES